MQRGWQVKRMDNTEFRKENKMPTIICSYCDYVGQGDEYEDRIQDVERHEEYCPIRMADAEAEKIDAAYEQARNDNRIDFGRKNV